MYIWKTTIVNKCFARGIWIVQNKSLSTGASREAPVDNWVFVCMFEKPSLSTGASREASGLFKTNHCPQVPRARHLWTIAADLPPTCLDLPRRAWPCCHIHMYGYMYIHMYIRDNWCNPRPWSSWNWIAYLERMIFYKFSLFDSFNLSLSPPLARVARAWLSLAVRDNCCNPRPWSSWNWIAYLERMIFYTFSLFDPFNLSLSLPLARVGRAWHSLAGKGRKNPKLLWAPLSLGVFGNH